MPSASWWRIASSTAGVAVAEGDRPHAHAPVEVLVAVHVPDVAALAPPQVLRGDAPHELAGTLGEGLRARGDEPRGERPEGVRLRDDGIGLVEPHSVRDDGHQSSFLRSSSKIRSAICRPVRPSWTRTSARRAGANQRPSKATGMSRGSEAVAHHELGHDRVEASRSEVVLEGHEEAGLPRRGQDRDLVHRLQRAQVDETHGDAPRLQEGPRLLRFAEEDPVGQDPHPVARREHLRAAGHEGLAVRDRGGSGRVADVPGRAVLDDRGERFRELLAVGGTERPSCPGMPRMRATSSSAWWVGPFASERRPGT